MSATQNLKVASFCPLVADQQPILGTEAAIQRDEPAVASNGRYRPGAAGRERRQ
jgi:hypothetical protein